MRIKTTLLAGLAALSSSVTLSSAASAQPPACVANLANAGAAACVQVVLVARQSPWWTSYGHGVLTKSGSTMSGTFAQLFSDRTQSNNCSGPPGGCSVCDTQHFYQGAAGNQRVSIDTNTGLLTITDLTWNGTTVLQTSCDQDVITASDTNGNGIVVRVGWLHSATCSY